MKEKTIGFRVSQQELETVEAIAKKMGRSQSDALRLMVREFAVALGIAPSTGKPPVIRIIVERVAELEY